MKNKKGSAAVLLAMISVVMCFSILASFAIVRSLAVSSECEAFGRVWTKAILSEYDRHLLDDYGIMAYQGNENEVRKRLATYMNYSMSANFNVSIQNITSELSGYEMNDPDNFKKALQNGFASNAAGSLLSSSGRKQRAEGSEQNEKDGRVIRNPVVIDTLPSKGISNSIDIDAIADGIKEGNYLDQLRTGSFGAAVEFQFLKKYMNSHVMTADSGKHYFNNELEYIIRGSTDDEKNFKSCKRRIFLLRNALNLVYLYKDPEKVEIVTAVAEIITPGPLGIVTQTILMEAWAAAESEWDVKTLIRGKRVPAMKTDQTWHTDLKAIIGTEEVQEKLDDESRKLLEENESEVEETIGDQIRKMVEDGLTYEDYLMILMLTVNDHVRILRIMDLVQINMKYRYYRDFNLAEYYGGVRFAYQVNGKEYSFEDQYQ